MAVNLNGSNPTSTVQDNSLNSVSRSGHSRSFLNGFTMNEGDMRPFYYDRCMPNTNKRIKQTYVLYQSPLVTRNFLEQKIHTHYFAQSIKNMWHDYKRQEFNGRYQDWDGEELHFAADMNSCERSTSVPHAVYSYDGIYDNPPPDSSTYPKDIQWCFFDGSSAKSMNGSAIAIFNRAFSSAFADNFYAPNSLGDNFGMEIDKFISEKLTPNPWLFFLYLNSYRHFILNKFLVRASRFRKIWFPDDDEEFTFKVSVQYMNDKAFYSPLVGRFFSPQTDGRAGYSIRGLKISVVKIAVDATHPLPSYQVFITYDMYSHYSSKRVMNSIDTDSVPFFLVQTLSASPDKRISTLHYLLDELFASPNTISQSKANRIADTIKALFLDVDEFFTNTKYGHGYYRTDTTTGKRRLIAPFNVSFPKMLDMFEIRYRNFDSDISTAGLTSPLLGDYPSLSGSVTTLFTPSGTVETTLSGGSVESSLSADSGIFSNTIHTGGAVLGVNAVGGSGSENEKLNLIASSATGSTPITDSVLRSQFINTLNSVSVDSVLTNPTATSVFTGNPIEARSSFALTIPELRLLSSTNQYLEALSMCDGDYENQVRVIYGVTPHEVSSKPLLIGGSATNVITDDVVQNSSTTSESPLGLVTQRGSAGKRDTIASVFAKDSMVFIGVMSCVPQITYCQGIDKLYRVRSNLDIPNPMFNGILMTHFENANLFISGDDEKDLAPFSYVGYADFMRSNRNKLSGLLRPHFDENGNLLDKPFTQMVQTRIFTETPSFNLAYVSTKDNVTYAHLFDTDVDRTPEFVVRISNDVFDVAPIPKRAYGYRV